MQFGQFMTSKNANWHRILPVGPGGSTLIKSNYKMEMGGSSISPLCWDYPEFLSSTNKQTVDSLNLIDLIKKLNSA